MSSKITKTRNLDAVVTIRLSSDLKAAVVALAVEEQRSLSSMVVALVQESVRKRRKS